jgi:hypothetical protein
VHGEARTFSDGAMCANNPTHFALLEAAEIAFAVQASSANNNNNNHDINQQQQQQTAYKEDIDDRGVKVVVSLGCGQRAAAVNTVSGGGSSWLSTFSIASNMLVGLFNLMTDSV